MRISVGGIPFAPLGMLFALYDEFPAKAEDPRSPIPGTEKPIARRRNAAGVQGNSFAAVFDWMFLSAYAMCNAALNPEWTNILHSRFSLSDLVPLPLKESLPATRRLF
jgi:hypothetical protein